MAGMTRDELAELLSLLRAYEVAIEQRVVQQVALAS
jgi:hypothetical protein